MKRILFIIVTLFILTPSSLSYAKGRGKSSVAIVADKEVFTKLHSSLESYAASIERDGKKVFIIEERWNSPDSIRALLHKLYRESNLEGAVFVGDIPIPMIRNAQHLTTAFKMDQNRPWDQSSVPSDRFYDDFDLQFDFLHRDTANRLYFYYNLSPSGAQKVASNIYSARIKPPHYNGKERIELLQDYFAKVVKEKEQVREIKNISYFGGQGYNSNCLVARADERLSLGWQFKALSTGKGSLTYIDHTYDDYVKERLLAELSREELDLAILHHHGSDDSQLLNGTPITSMADKWLEMARKFFRGKIRGSKDSTASKQYYIENYNVPESWVANAFDPEVMLKDSIADAMVDIHIPDLYGRKFGARFIMLDACFNGSFHLEDYISGHYIFNPGSTVVVKANSVNTLQDVWTNQLIGLLDLGVCIGNWAKEQFTLESHLIGDPTFHYASSNPTVKDLDYNMTHGANNLKYWRAHIKSDNSEMRSLAIKRLYNKGQLQTSTLLTLQQNDPSPTIRMMAFMLINQSMNEWVVPSLKAGLYDNYEMIRRFAAKFALTNQSPELLEELVAINLSPGASKRVEFQVKGAIDLYPKEEVLKLYDKLLAEHKEGWYLNGKINRDRFENSATRREAEYEQLFDTGLSPRSRRLTISALRNSSNVTHLDKLFKFMKESKEDDLRLMLAEAFGWFTNSWKRDQIIAFCKEQVARESNEAIKNELLRSINRLKD